MKKTGGAGYSSSNNTKEDTRNEQAAQDKESEKEEDDPYKILGIDCGASREEIKEAYAKLAAKYHPDKVQHLGTEFQELAHEKFIAIQKAYDSLSG